LPKANSGLPGNARQNIDGTPIHPDEFASGKLEVDVRSTTTLWQFVATAVAEFERIVLDADSRPIDISVKSRGFPDWMKRALLIAARGMMPFGLASQVQPEFAVRQTRPTDKEKPASPAGKSFDVRRRRTRVRRAKPGRTVIPDNKWKRDFVA
jgi:hypothetical protein